MSSCNGDAVLARPLGRVQSLVRRLDEILGGGRHVLGEGGDAEARRHATLVGELIRRENIADAIRVEARPRLGRLHQEDGELVAAIAADDVDAARMPEQDLGHPRSVLVARGMAQVVVDGLEAVEIEEHHRHRVVEPTIARDFLLEADGEEAAL